MKNITARLPSKASRRFFAPKNIFYDIIYSKASISISSAPSRCKSSSKGKISATSLSISKNGVKFALLFVYTRLIGGGGGASALFGGSSLF